ncbi:MAG: gamma-glutamyl-gamma-aminobutyrate hydrolase family protein [Acidimicrobiales bacterium]
MHPVIGISAHPRVIETATGPTLLHTASRHYVDSVVRAGGLPVILPIVDPEEAAHALSFLHGLLITGGGDVAPARYHAKPIAETRNVDPARDAFDVALLGAAIDRDFPVLATCRGMQVLNVALGGSLVQHVPAVTGENHDRADRWNDVVHEVRVEPDSHLAEALGCTTIKVNSIHHQAVCDPAPGTKAVAWADDDTVEAIELPGSPHVVAVQWHPELLEDIPAHQGLFRQLVEHAAALATAR